MRRCIFSLLACAAVVAVGCGPGAAQAGLPGGAGPAAVRADHVYPPVIMLGSAKATRVLNFVWGANQASAHSFARYILPLYERTKASGDITIILTQYFLNDRMAGSGGKPGDYIDVRGPGALLFCAPDRSSYAKAAMRYMADPTDHNRVVRPSGFGARLVAVNPALNAALREINVDMDACLKGNDLYDRVAFALAFTEPTRQQNAIDALPAFFLDGTRLYPERPADMARIEALAKPR